MWTRGSHRTPTRAFAHVMRATTRVYLTDASALAHVSRVTRVERDAERGVTVELAETILHPAGGGQPSDRGVVEALDGSWIVDVDRAEYDRVTGVVTHVGRARVGEARAGDAARAAIDAEARRLHSRIHSAGHALDVAMLRIGLPPTVLVPTKGQHFVSEAYVEYRGTAGGEYADGERLARALEGEMAKIIAENQESAVAEMSYEEARAACGDSLPSFITPDMRPRVVTIVPDTPGCPCGGTHIKSMADIGAFKCTGVRVKKGVTRVSYSIPGMETWSA